jgi:hypothetical protein
VIFILNCITSAAFYVKFTASNAYSDQRTKEIQLYRQLVLLTLILRVIGFLDSSSALVICVLFNLSFFN